MGTVIQVASLSSPASATVPGILGHHKIMALFPGVTIDQEWAGREGQCSKLVYI